MREDLPPDVRVTPVYDRAELVNNTVATVLTSLLEGGLLVVAVLFILLGNIRAALVVALVIPFSMLFAVLGMQRFGISGNLMSLGAIDFGLIVDGAVVIVENAVRRLADARKHAGRTLSRSEVREHVGWAAQQVTRPVAFAVTIITVVYLPVLALEGTEGKMFKPMAFTVVFALLGALILSLTAVPALATLVLSGDTREPRNVVMQATSRAYRRTLDAAMRLPAITLGISAALVVGAGLLYMRLGSEFIPQLDEGALVVQSIRLRSVSAGETIRLVTAAERALLTVPEVATVFSRSGTAEVATDPMPMSLTDAFIMLKPRREWRRGLTRDELVHEMEEKLKAVPGQAYSFSQPIQLRFAELVAGVKSDVGVKVFGDDMATLKKTAGEVAALLKDVKGAEDVSVEQVDDIPALEVRVDRQAIARVGVNVADVLQWVETTMGGKPLRQIIEGDRRFDLVATLPERLRGDVEAIRALPIATPAGGVVTLGSVADIAVVQSPAQISRESGRRRVVVQLNVRGRDLAGFVAEAQTAIKRDLKLPEGVYLTWGGQFENLQRAQSRLMLVAPMALGLIFVLLFMTFGSVRQAALIFTGVPLAVTGGVLSLWLRGLPFSISAGVGFIALSGVAVLNGVVMVSAINGLRTRGMGVLEAVREGAAIRLRPVLMTALVAALGFVPMALATGPGSTVQRPVATVVVGGIVTSTLLSLIVLPTLYARFRRRKAEEAE